MSSLRALLLAYLLNSLWQVPLFFAGASLAALALRGYNPRVVHRLWVATLLLETFVPALCLRSWPWLDVLTHLAPFRHRDPASSVTFTFGPAATLVAGLPTPLRSPLVLAYVLCTIYFALRLLWGLHQTFALRRSASLLPVSPATLEAWARITRHFAVEGRRPCRVCSYRGAHSPSVSATNSSSFPPTSSPP